mmetsp:Transcript_34830/g.75315  ORF Transcript_34830/g.75315 Transcript_34830/m.75315 type:complete len:165 (-) Transcript_34830:312-806(-)
MPPPVPVWRKILWEKQPFEDNYTDHTFLDALVTNANFHEYDLVTLITDSAVITQHWSTVTIFVCVFAHMLVDRISSGALLVVDCGLLLLGYAFVAVTNLERGTVLPFLTVQFKRCAIFTALLLILAPMLHTLTRSIWDDTIWALVLGMVAQLRGHFFIFMIRCS